MERNDEGPRHPRRHATRGATRSCASGIELLNAGQKGQSGGKLVVAFASAMDVDPATVRSNRVEIEWPPRSGRRIEISEIDEARWFTLEAARVAMLASQRPFVNRLSAAFDFQQGV